MSEKEGEEEEEDVAPTKVVDKGSAPHVATAARPSQRLSFSMAARTLVLAPLVVAFGSLAALAIVASVSNADALSTIALALAILAFAIQILVFVVQSQTASQQMLQSEQLNTQTRSLLAEVKTASDSMQSMLGEQFSNLLQAFTQAATTASGAEGKFNPEEFERRITQNIQMATAGQRQDTEEAGRARRLEIARRETRTRPARDRIAHLLETWPDEDKGRQAVEKVKELSPAARSRLAELGADERRSRRGGSYIGLSDHDPGDEELSSKGLITDYREEIGGDPILVRRLTSDGRQVACLFTATGEIPDYAKDVSLSRDQGSSASDDDIPF